MIFVKAGGHCSDLEARLPRAAKAERQAMIIGTVQAGKNLPIHVRHRHVPGSEKFILI
ncbi:hypothetical protein [Bradyrhizobium sp. RT5a]|uniref:hypothetical protein n=1 Tax=unclassified Bradyrhizobium TaxID=2631580 RepID=UPI003398202B